MLVSLQNKTLKSQYSGYQVKHQKIISFGQYYSFKEIAQFIKNNDINALKTISNYSVVDSSYKNILHLCALENKPELTQYFIQNGTDINQKDINGNTPLHYSIHNPKLAELLLHNKANPYIRNNDGLSVLLTCADHIDTVEMLLKKGVSPNSIDNNEQTLLHIASKKGDTALGSKLIEYKGEVNYPDKNGCTPLFFAKNENFIDFLKNAKADMNFVNQKAESALFKFVKDNNPECIVAILKAGANPNLQDNCGKTPLLYAKNNAIREILLTGGADPDVRLEDRKTLLHVASSIDSLPTAELLIRYNANPVLKDKNNASPLAYAQSNAMRKLLLENGADVNEMNYLMFALMTKNKEYASMLIEKGADVNMKYPVDDSTTLFYCTDKDEIEMLINHGADINIKDKKGNTAMHRYMISGKKELAQVLKDAGADETVKNNLNRTPSDNFILWEKYNKWFE